MRSAQSRSGFRPPSRPPRNRRTRHVKKMWSGIVVVPDRVPGAIDGLYLRVSRVRRYLDLALVAANSDCGIAHRRSTTPESIAAPERVEACIITAAP